MVAGTGGAGWAAEKSVFPWLVIVFGPACPWRDKTGSCDDPKTSLRLAVAFGDFRLPTGGDAIRFAVVRRVQQGQGPDPGGPFST